MKSLEVAARPLRIYTGRLSKEHSFVQDLSPQRNFELDTRNIIYFFSVGITSLQCEVKIQKVAPTATKNE